MSENDDMQPGIRKFAIELELEDYETPHLDSDDAAKAFGELLKEIVNEDSLQVITSIKVTPIQK